MPVFQKRFQHEDVVCAYVPQSPGDAWAVVMGEVVGIILRKEPKLRPDAPEGTPKPKPGFYYTLDSGTEFHDSELEPRVEDLLERMRKGMDYAWKRRSKLVTAS